MAVRKKSNAELLTVTEDLPSVTSFLSTGCTILDLAIADRLPGGFPAGRISHLYGPESSCKSVLVAEPLGSAQRQGGKAFMVDAECTFDFSRAGIFGLNTHSDVLDYVTGDDVDDFTIEWLFNKYFPRSCEAASELKGPSMCGVDSLSSISSRVESEEDIGTATYGTSRAKALSIGFRKALRTFSAANLAMLFVDQTRDDVGGNSKYTFSGGNALRFYASVRVLVEKIANITNKYGKIIGVDVAFKVDKNKISPPFRAGVFSLIFDYGIDDIRTNIMWLKDNGPEAEGEEKKKKSAWFTVPGTDRKFNSTNEAIFFVEDNGLEDTLRQAVYDRWREIYSRQDRKPRVR